MKSIKILTVVTLFNSTIVLLSSPVFADTETTTYRRISFTSGQQLSLPTTSKYVLVDPITGNVKGNFDPSQGLSDPQMFQPGLIVIDQPSGRMIATVDPSGKTIDIASVPAINSLIVQIYTRRCELERMITDSFANNTINTSQASLLRAETDKIASAEFMAKQNGGILTYAEAISLAISLNNISDQLVSFTHAVAVPPLLGSRFVSVNGQIVMVRSSAQ